MVTVKTDTTFETYLNELDEKDQETIIRLDQMLTKQFGKDNRNIWEGKFWGGSQQQIVGYGEIPIKGKTDETWFMVGLARQKAYFSLYVNAVEDKTYLAKKYQDQLGKVKVGSSSISFKQFDDIDLPTLEKVFNIAYQQWLEIKQ